MEQSRNHGKEHTDTTVSAAYSMIDEVYMYLCICPVCCPDFNIIDDTTLYCYEVCVCTYIVCVVYFYIVYCNNGRYI